MQEEFISGEDPRAQSKKVGRANGQGTPWKWIAIVAIVLLLGVSWIALTKHPKNSPSADSGAPGTVQMNGTPSGDSGGPSTQSAGGGSTGSGPQTYQN